jgi:hypothetical protein
VVVGCDIGSACVQPFCANGNCLMSAVNCDDFNPCTADTCTAGSGCIHTPIANCGGCTSNAQCDDKTACSTDTCDPTTKQCRHQFDPACRPCTADNVALVCNDYDACTYDVCGSDGNCAYVPTGAEECVTEFCQDDLDCVDSSTCTIGRCDQFTGLCEYLAALCEDSNPCTVDGPAQCVEGIGCLNAVDPTCGGSSCLTAADCPVESPCFIPACSAGKCTGAWKTCNDGNACTGDYCDNADGVCKTFPAQPCTAKPCTTSADCGQGNCEIAECRSGTCVVTPTPCNDNDPCTQDECVTDACVFSPVPGCTGCSVDTDCDDTANCTEDNCYGPGDCRHEPAIYPGCPESTP